MVGASGHSPAFPLLSSGKSCVQYIVSAVLLALVLYLECVRDHHRDQAVLETVSVHEDLADELLDRGPNGYISGR
jgi:hypothetical protein